MPKRPGRKSAAQTPAPKSDRIYGSSKNPEKSASSEKSASAISLSIPIIKALQSKLEKFKETHNTKKVSLSDLKAVYRRGLGAYSKSHRPTITGGVPNSRNAWAMARVNKFLLKAGGTKVKAAYVQDDDLLKYEGGGLVKGRLYAIRGKFNNKYRFIEEVTYMGINKGFISFSNVSYDGKVTEIIMGSPKEIKIYKRVQGEWTEIVNPKFDDENEEYKSGGKTFSFEKLKNDLQEFAELEFYEGEKYSDISVSCDLAKGNCYDISEELYDFLKIKGYKDLSLVEVRNPLFDLVDAHYEWKEIEYSDLYHIMLKVNDYYIDFTGIQYSKEDIGLKIYTEDQLKNRWGKMSFFDREESEYKEGGKVWNDKELLKRYNNGESIGFSGIAHLKAQGLIKRADGTKRKSMADGGYQEGGPILYHGTNNKFKIKDIILPAHFGTKEAAKDFGKYLIQAKVNIKNPIRMYDNQVQVWDLDTVGGTLKNELKIPESVIDSYRNKYGEVLGLVKLLESKGYDGIVYENNYEDIGSDSYIVFNQNQIEELMTDGGETEDKMIQLPDVQTFDSENPDIRFGEGGETDLDKIYKIQKMQQLQATMADGGLVAPNGQTSREDSIKNIETMAKGAKIKAKGDCYVAAGDIVMDYLISQRGFGAFNSEFQFHGTPYLVHAEVAGQGHLEGIRYGHAWIEDDQLVYDYSNGRKIVFPKQLYYSIGDVDVDDPMKYQKYTFEEAKNRMMKTGNYGCWDIDVEYADGGSVIGERKIQSARITNTEWIPKVYVTYEDGYEEPIFEYYSDEIEFSPNEFVGLTKEQANELRDKKQTTYNLYSNEGVEFKDGGDVSQDIICANCTWEWNTSQSDPSDKYICHNCGFDNTLFYTVLKETMPIEHIAEKHGVDLEYLQSQLEEGIKHEMDEHTKGGTNLAKDIAEIIALHHLEEMPDYYEKIKLLEKDYENGGGVLSKEQYLENLLTEAFELLDAHINNGGILDYSDKEYGYLNDEVEDVQVGYFKDEDLDSSYAERLREEGFELSLDEAIDILEHRLSSIDEEMKELFGNEYSTRWDDFKKNNKYEMADGGKTEDCGCGSNITKMGNYVLAKGGLAYGNSHDKGGMPMKVQSTGQNIEIEGGEGVINKRSMQMTKKVNFEGKMMTPCEVISKINEMGGGVKFDCSDVKEIIEKDGDF